MKTLVYIFVFIFIFIALDSNAQVTEFTKKSENNEKIVKNSNEINSDIIYADWVKTNGDDIIVQIFNPNLKNELISNSKSRDALLSLNGVVQLSLFYDDNFFTVVLKRNKASELLKTQFDIEDGNIQTIINQSMQ